MLTILTTLPILTVILLMVFSRWSGQKAGLAGWVISAFIAVCFYGLPISGLVISQLRGLYLSGFVLAIIWPALGLYQLVYHAGSIQALADWVSGSLQDQGLLQIGLAWAFSGMIEGLAGFGLPVAVVSPLLVGIGVSPVIAVAATAVGHSWSVTFGDMGVIFQTLVAITGVDPQELIPPSTLMLGVACLACGLGAMIILGQNRLWRQIILLGVLMAITQYVFVRIGLVSLSAFLAGFVGIVSLLIFSKKNPENLKIPISLKAAVVSYSSLAVLMILTTSVPAINQSLQALSSQLNFPGTLTTMGYQTLEIHQRLNIFLHPGVILTLVTGISMLVYKRMGILPENSINEIFKKTWHSAAPTSMGVIAMVGLATIMDYSGMMMNLAQALGQLAGSTFPIIAPLIGILGAFATGSNNNSNVIFAQLQLNTSLLLGLPPAIILAAQTTGGALGSMLSPAKIIVGCSTVGLLNGQGQVLRRTLGFGIGIGIVIGIITLLLTL